MNLTFATSIYHVVGVVLGINYWSSELDENVINEATISGEIEHELQIFFFFVGISFVWYSDKK